MVKTRGPQLSLDASGSIAGAITFSNWKGRSYAKKLSKPANPKTAGQVRARAWLRFFSEEWTQLTGNQTNTWINAAAELDIPPYNLFVKNNLDLVSHFNWPTKRFTPASGHTACEMNDFAATALNRSIQLDVEWAEPFNAWGIAIFRSTSTGFTPGINNLVLVRRWTPSMNNQQTYFDGPLDPGTYYYREITFSDASDYDDTFATEPTATLS